MESLRSDIITKLACKNQFRSLCLLLFIITLLFSLTRSLKESTISFNLKDKKGQSHEVMEFNSEEVEVLNGIQSVKVIEDNQNDKDYYFVSTLEGNIHAFSSTNKELWKISLGKPLITTHFNSENFLYDKNAIIPGLDGNIYFYSNQDSNEDGDPSTLLRKVDVPLKTLIDNTPFTFPNLPEYIFIGEKKSQILTIDVDKGAILNINSNGEENLLHKRVIQSKNLLSVIRIDYTLICLNHEGAQNWNVTVSEVMAIQKGSKNEIILKRENSDLLTSNSENNKIKIQNEIDNKLSQLINENPNLYSVVSVHKYNNKNNLPIKIYDLKPTKQDNGFINFINQKNKNYVENNGIDDDLRENSDNKFHEMLSEYLKWSNSKIKNKNFDETSTLSRLIFKFWEMYYFEDYFFIYITVIFILTILVIILSTVIIRYKIRNSKLKKKVSKFRKISDEQKSKSCEIVCLDNNNDCISFKNNFTNEIKDNVEEKIPLEEKQFYTETKNEDPLETDQDKSTTARNISEINKDKSETGLVPYIENDKVVSDLVKSKEPTIENITKVLLLQPRGHFDTGLTEFEKENVAKSSVILYKDLDGNFVKEESHFITTKYENNQIVENKLTRLSQQLNNFGNNEDITNNKEKSKDLYEDNLDMQGPLLNMNVTVKQENQKMMVYFDNECKRNKDKKFEDLIDRSINNSVQKYISSKAKSKSPQKKHNLKDYSFINKEKINTTHIDEGRLEKTFEAIDKIGQGGFGCVFKGQHRIDGSFYAIKMIELKVNFSKNLMEHKVIKEAKTMMKLNHKNVVRYITCWFQLKIDNIVSLIDISRMSNDVNSITSRSKTFTYSKRGKKLEKNNYFINKTILNEISENEEKSSLKSSNAFNWNESFHTGNSKKDNPSIIFMEETKNNLSQNVEKAFSVSLEKRENSNSGNFSDSHKNSFDDSFVNTKKTRQNSYTVYFFMQMEYCDGLPLNQFLELNKDYGLDRRIIFNFFKQIVSGVNHIHKNNVIHRDLKPHNIFIFGKDSLKIGDFGLATELDGRDKNKVYIFNNANNNNNCNTTYDSVKLSEFVGTPLYQSPEQVQGLHYNQKVDIYAMGLILFEMCSSFKTGMERREGIEKLKNEFTIREHLKAKYPLESKLILWMTNPKPSERPNSQEILDSSIFRELKAIIERIN